MNSVTVNPASAGDDYLLEVQDLRVRFQLSSGTLHALNGVAFGVRPGETLGIVGESGSGKSVTTLAVMGLLPRANCRVSGRVLFGHQDLLQMSERAMRDIRGSKISMVFQNPATSLDPRMRIGRQIAEVLVRHEGSKKAIALRQAAALLGLVQIPDPLDSLDKYPHEFSGGMQQRITIAMALALEPQLLIADEPTTALDVTIQAQILELLKERTSESGMAVILVTHNLGVAAGVTQRIAVMYGGFVVESGATRDIFYSPRHPYTVGLLGSLPRGSASDAELKSISGMPPVFMGEPHGCPFAARCDRRLPICSQEMPPLQAGTVGSGAPGHADDGHAVACHNPMEGDAAREIGLVGLST